MLEKYQEAWSRSEIIGCGSNNDGNCGRVAGDGLRQNHSPLLSRPLAALVSEPWNSNHLFATGGQSLESQAGNSENSAHPSFAEWQPNQHCWWVSDAGLWFQESSFFQTIQGRGNLWILCRKSDDLLRLERASADRFERNYCWLHGCFSEYRWTWDASGNAFWAWFNCAWR